MRKQQPDTMVSHKLFSLLPVLPEPAIKISKLAKLMGVSNERVRKIILCLPPEAPVYEDFGEIGRIR